MPCFVVDRRATSRAAVLAGVFFGCFAGAHASTLAVTYNPGVVVPSASSFTADQLNMRNYERIDVGNSSGGSTAFTASGYEQINNVSLNNVTFNPSGNRSSYSLYVAFTGAGMMTNPNFSGSGTGTFTSLNFTLYEAAGAASFGIDGSNDPFVMSAGSVAAVATGSLLSGSDSFSAGPLGYGANFTTTFDQLLAGFIVAPQTSFDLSFFQNSQATNTSVVNGGRTLVIDGGASDVQAFGVASAATPEPSSLMLLGSGVAGLAGVLRRRRR